MDVLPALMVVLCVGFASSMPPCRSGKNPIVIALPKSFIDQARAGSRAIVIHKQHLSEAKVNELIGNLPNRNQIIDLRDVKAKSSGAIVIRGQQVSHAEVNQLIGKLPTVTQVVNLGDVRATSPGVIVVGGSSLPQEKIDRVIEKLKNGKLWNNEDDCPSTPDDGKDKTKIEEKPMETKTENITEATTEATTETATEATTEMPPETTTMHPFQIDERFGSQ